MEKNIQHVNGGSKSALGNLAVLFGVVRLRNRARLSKIPGHIALVPRVRVIGASLAVDGDGIKNREAKTDGHTENRVEKLHDDHDHLDEQDEE